VHVASRHSHTETHRTIVVAVPSADGKQQKARREAGLAR
jgi:hypothetical protein